MTDAPSFVKGPDVSVLDDPEWRELPEEGVAESDSCSLTDLAVGPAGHRFYRVCLLP